MEANIPVVILCGGRGTRLRERTESIPKALVEIGGMPILWHVIGIYAAQGFSRFLIATGHKGDQIAGWAASGALPAELDVECVPTGPDTPTGGRVKALEARLGGESFALTYGDGLANIDLAGLERFHAGHGRAATVTVVQPELQFGVAEIDEEGRVRGFSEKPRLDRWINGGFFRMEAEALRYLEDDSVLERGPLERLAAADELRAYRHDGFWDCMDTYKDAVTLNDLWERGDPPWTTWTAAEQGGDRGPRDAAGAKSTGPASRSS